MATVAASRIPPPGQPDTSSTHPFTCNTCQVAFRSSELQRGHMRSDWHRYNLKRRVTSLPPIPSEVFTEKVLAVQASNNEQALKSTYEKSCELCAKTYFSENAYRNHIGSQKHRTRALIQEFESGVNDDTSSVMSSTFSLGEPMAAKKEVDLDSENDIEYVVTAVKKTNLEDNGPVSQPSASEAPPLPSTTPTEASTTSTITLNRCLFCNYDSPTVKLNVLHMERIHSMFIPEMPYLVDLEGLLAFLHRKIYEYHECLYCGKLKPSIFGLQTHMRDKGHCKIPFGTEDEQLDIGEFYDFRSTYSDEESEDSDIDEAGTSQGGVKLGLKRPTKITNEDGEVEVGEDDGWETDSSASSLDSEDLTAIPLDPYQFDKLHKHPHHSHEDPRPHRNVDGWHSHAHKHAHAAFYSDYELHLPSGRSVGHRSLARYYRQNLVNHPSPAERQEQLAIAAAANSDEEQDERSMRNAERERGRALATRANGGRGMIGVSDSKKQEVKSAEKRARKMEERERRRFQWGNNKQSNFQKHFRDPLLQ